MLNPKTPNAIDLSSWTREELEIELRRCYDYTQKTFATASGQPQWIARHASGIYFEIPGGSFPEASEVSKTPPPNFGYWLAWFDCFGQMEWDIACFDDDEWYFDGEKIKPLYWLPLPPSPLEHSTA